MPTNLYISPHLQASSPHGTEPPRPVDQNTADVTNAAEISIAKLRMTHCVNFIF